MIHLIIRQTVTYVKILLLIAVAALLTACAQQPQEEPDPNRYVFSYLEPVERISNFRLKGWTDIDRRTLVVRTSPKDKYLVVLSRGDNDLRFSGGIIISSKSGFVEPRFDTVTTVSDPGVPVPIKAIYKIANDEQLKQVKQQLGKLPAEES